MVSKRPGDVLSDQCPSRQVLDLVATKWSALVIYALSAGTRRYGDLARAIGGVSQKMLTQTLRDLEKDGLVNREVFPVVPPHVEYSLTPLGRSLLGPLGALCSWAQDHWGEVTAARERRVRQAQRAKSRPVAPVLRAPTPGS